MGREAMRQAGINIAIAMSNKTPRMVNNNDYQNYLLGNSWRCPDAPINPAIPLQVLHNTGSHHWLKFRDGKPGEFYCKYCFEIRKFKLSL
jgi:hypothetical protein